MKSTTKLREMMSQGLVVAPFCMNAFHAMTAQLVGFKAVYMTGFGTAAERGYPDVGLITQTEMVQNAKYMINSVSLPVVCDADTGYGGVINVARTIQEYEAVGAAAIHLEDQVFPKKCGLLAGKQVISMEEHVQKIRVACDSRQDKDLVIVARTDALAVSGWEDTVRRCHAYMEAGADVIFVDGIRNMEDLKNYAKKLKDLPRFLLGGAFTTIKEVADMGFKIFVGGSTIPVVFTAVKRALQEFMEKGFVSPEMRGEPPGSLKPGHEEFLKMLGLPAIYEMEKKYSIPGSRV
jgi:2-methylisocitrate lyase-like PEP mutase family enzyme